MKFSEIDTDEWYELYYKYFNPYDCWDNDCCLVEENLIYDENGEVMDEDGMYCDHCSEDECPMYEKWKTRETTNNKISV